MSDINTKLAVTESEAVEKVNAEIQAALREFVADGVDWVHIDVAGPAYNSGGAWGYTPKGGTGVPTRTMFAVLEDICERG